MDYSTVAADLNRDQPFLFRGGVIVDQSQLAKQIADEALVVNRTFAGLKIAAGTAPGGAWAVVAGSSYIAYGLRLAPAVKPGDVERAIPKLAEELSAARRRPPCPVAAGAGSRSSGAGADPLARRYVRCPQAGARVCAAGAVVG
jgi:hypothetical protein